MSKDKLKQDLEDLSKTRVGTDKDAISNDFYQDEERKPHTSLIKPSLIEKIKDYAHHMKMSEDPYYTQGDALEEALNMLFDKVGEIPERPEEIKRKERRRTGRRKGGINSSDPANPFA